MKSGSEKPHLWLGKYLTLALTLPASLVAGFILGKFAEHWLHLAILPVAGILVGMAGGIIQILRELARDDKR